MHLHNWYNHLSQEGKKYGYLGNGSKSWLLVKSDILVHEAKGCLEMMSIIHLKVSTT